MPPSAPIPFVKMHGIGNDYIYLDAVGDPALASRRDLDKLAIAMSDRHKGIGSDGIILVCLPTEAGRAAGAHVRMRMFNADGSESAMCGNGIRCVAKFAHDRLGVLACPMLVQTGRGVLSIQFRALRGKLVEATVDMGEPILTLGQIPVAAAKLSWGPSSIDGNSCCVETPDAAFTCVFVSMGNPHMVIMDPWSGGASLTSTAVQRAALDRFGPILEVHAAFPRRMNIHIAAVRSRSDVVMRTWERGAGLTQACGTGACAVVVAGVLTRRLNRDCRVSLPGGKLRIRWDSKSGHVFMTGPADEVFEGQWGST